MLHFAPRYGIISPCLMWGMSRPRDVPVRRPANDNSAWESANDDLPRREDALLEAALRLFAALGLSAARRACEAAAIAADSGDHAGATWWLEVCATFDGALARTAARSFATR